MTAEKKKAIVDLVFSGILFLGGGAVGYMLGERVEARRHMDLLRDLEKTTSELNACAAELMSEAIFAAEAMEESE